MTIEVTQRQNEYLKELAAGPKTTQDLVFELMISAKPISKMIKMLRDKGLVQSKPLPKRNGHPLLHSLTNSYDELVRDGLTVVSKNNAIPDAELQYAAELRDEGLVGQRLTGKYRKRFPERSHNSALYVVDKAIAEGLCR